MSNQKPCYGYTVFFITGPIDQRSASEIRIAVRSIEPVEPFRGGLGGEAGEGAY